MSPHSTLGLLANLDLAVECFGWCFVQVTLFAAAVAVVYRLTGRQRAGRNVALLVAGLAIVGLLTLASVSPWPRWNLSLFAAGDQSANDHLPAVGEFAAGSVDPQVRRNDAAAEIDDGGQRNRSNRDAVEAAAALHGDAAHANRPALDKVGTPWSYYVVAAAWAAAMFGLVRLLVGLVFLRRHRRSSRPIDDPAMCDWFDKLRDKLGVSAAVELRESDSLEVAATIGWRRPLILLPASWRDWSSDQRRAVLAHELAHVAERHVPQWLVSQVATVPHFYHPLVHWLGRRLRLEQELAADRLAARTFGSRRRYADALAALALGRVRPAGPLSALGLFMSRPLLMRRIAMLRQPTTRPRRRSQITHFLALSLVVLTAVAVAGLRASANDGDEPAKSELASAETVDTPVESKEHSAEQLVWNLAGMAGGPTREVTALLLVSSDSGKLFDRAGGGQSWRIYSRTQAALLSSNIVLQTALEKPEVEKLPLVTAQREPIEWLRERLEVGFLPDTELMRVHMKGNSDEVEQLRTIVDTVIKTYLDEFVHAEDRRRAALRDALAKSLGDVNREMSNKMEDYFDLARELGAADAFRQDDPERSLALNEITESLRAKTELQRQLAQLQTNFLVTRQQLTDRQEIDSTREESIEALLANDPNLAMLQQQLMGYQMKLAEEHAQTRQSTPARARLQKQIEAVEQQIEQLREQMKQSFDGSKRDESTRELKAITKEYELRTSLLQRRIQELEGAIAEKTEQLMKKSEHSVDLRIKAAALEQLQQISREMSIRLEQMDVEASVPHDRVRVIQWAM